MKMSGTSEKMVRAIKQLDLWMEKESRPYDYEIDSIQVFKGTYIFTVTEISPSGVKDTTYSIGVGEDGQVGI
jgi:hypothetical protein